VDIGSVGANRIYDFIDKAANVGLKAVLEVSSQAEKDQLIKAACGTESASDCVKRLGNCIAPLPPKRNPKTGKMEQQITATHFSVYNDDAGCTAP
jgi:hypothetical protein